MNPYYDCDQLNWEMLELNDDDDYYRYNTLLFWRTPEGKVFTATDSGCSCPTPFEEFSGSSARDIEQLLERVGSFDQGQRIIAAWNARHLTSLENVYKVEEVLKKWFTNVPVS